MWHSWYGEEPKERPATMLHTLAFTYSTLSFTHVPHTQRYTQTHTRTHHAVSSPLWHMKDIATLWVLDDAQMQTHTTLSCQSFTGEVGCCVALLSTYSTCFFTYIHVSKCVSPSVSVHFVSVFLHCARLQSLPFILSAEGNRTWTRAHNWSSLQTVLFRVPHLSSHRISTHNGAVMDRIVTEWKKWWDERYNWTPE